MSEKLTLEPQDDFVLQLAAHRNEYKKLRGTFKSPNGYTLPKTTYHDVEQLAAWWHNEYKKVRKQKPWHKDSAQRIWENHARTIAADLKQASDLDAEYPKNYWFWNIALIKLSIYLESQKIAPSPTTLFWEALEETVIDQFTSAGKTASKAIDTVAEAAETVSKVGESAWSGIKIAAIVGGGLIGAAVALPPIIRAFRTPTTTTPAERTNHDQ